MRCISPAAGSAIHGWLSDHLFVSKFAAGGPHGSVRNDCLLELRLSCHGRIVFERIRRLKAGSGAESKEDSCGLRVKAGEVAPAWRNRAGAAREETKGNCWDGGTRLWRGSESRAEGIHAGGKETTGPGHSRREKSASEISRDWGTGRGENPAVFEAGARGRRPASRCRGARAAVVRQGREKLCRGLPRRARYLYRVVIGDLCSSAKGLLAAEKTRA